MLDEDVVLKYSRYTNERVLMVNILGLIALPAIFNGGNSIVAFCIIFSAAILAPINVMTYPINWIDAPDFTRSKYALCLAPYIAFFALACARIFTPAMGLETFRGEEFFVFSEKKGELLSAAFSDSFSAIANSLEMLCIAACAISIFFVTQSRFVLQTILTLCAGAVLLLALLGGLSAGLNNVGSASLAWFFGDESFSTFKNAENWSVFATLWACAAFASGIYTIQRFRLIPMITSVRSLILLGGLALIASAIFTASAIFLPYIYAILCAVFLIYAFNALPTQKNLRMHWKAAERGSMPKRAWYTVALPFVIYLTIALASAVSCVFALQESQEYSREFNQTAEAAELRALESDVQALIKEKPLFGWGNYPVAISLAAGDDIKFYPRQSPQTDILKMLVENGWIGILLVSFIPAILILKTIFNLTISKSGVIILFGLLSCLAYSFQSTPFQCASVMLSFWVLLLIFIAWENAEIR